MSEHPTTFRLDAYAAGDRNDRIAQHLEHCEGCAAYVQQAIRLAQTFAAGDGTRAADFVLALDDRRRSSSPDESDVRLREAPSVWSQRAPWLGGAILAAAAALLLVVPTTSIVPSSIAVPSEPAVRFKGKLQVAVIRDRVGEQSRIATEVRVRPGDRLRAEISVDDTRPIEVGFLGKDGTWILLLAPTLVEAGTYFSEKAAQFDDTPTEGWIVAGRPDDVARAKVTRSFDDVSAIPVVMEP